MFLKMLKREVDGQLQNLKEQLKLLAKDLENGSLAYGILHGLYTYGAFMKLN
jgi:hypothetical protein